MQMRLRGERPCHRWNCGGGPDRSIHVVLTSVVAAILFSGAVPASTPLLFAAAVEASEVNDAPPSDTLSPPLAPEERNLLASLSIGDVYPLPRSIAEYDSALSSRIEASTSVNERGGKILGSARRARDRAVSLAERTKRLEAEVRRRNYDELRKLWVRINATLGEELRRRDALDERREAAEREGEEWDRRRNELADVGGGKKGRGNGGEKEPRVTVDQLEEALDLNVIMAPSEAELEKRATSLAQEEMSSIVDTERTRLEERAVSREERSKCIDPVQAGSMVRESLIKYAADGGVGRHDFASLENGGAVSHAEGMTSNPYDPLDKAGRVPVGRVWWRRYVPEDWEPFLPRGWEGWTVPADGLSGFIPSYVWSSLGFKSSPVQTPEIALTSNNNVGSCYPLPGRSGGRLTVLLPQPVLVDAVSVDHVPAVLGGDKGRSSAVRYFRVAGYPPCPKSSNRLSVSEREECERVGFNTRTAIDLGSYEYKLVPSKADADGNARGGRSVQTFNVTEALERAEESSEFDSEEGNEEDEEEAETTDDEEEGDPGMCTVEKASSCGDPGGLERKKKKKMKAVGAVAIVVEDNWGMAEYTCLYRFRVHGKKANM